MYVYSRAAGVFTYIEEGICVADSSVHDVIHCLLEIIYAVK